MTLENLYKKTQELPEDFRKRLEILLINSSLSLNEKHKFVDLYIDIYKAGTCTCP